MPRKKSLQNSLRPEKQIQLFLKRYEEMWNCRAYKKGLNVSLNFSWKKDDELLRTSSTEPDNEEFRSFLLVFRKFISPNSDIFLPKIYNLCHLYILNEECRNVLAEARNIWNEISKTSDSGMSLTINHKELSTEEIVDMWINGEYFHDDTKAMEILENLESYQHIASKTIFLDYVIETTKVIQHLAQNIKVAQNRGWFKFPS